METAAHAGYYLSDAAMRGTVAGWPAARERLAIRQGVIDGLRAVVDEQAKSARGTGRA